MNITDTSKPYLYQNRQLPLGELSSDSFEDFVYQSLVQLEDQKKFRMQSGRQPSGDEGFDCTAKTTTNNELVCIQYLASFKSTLQSLGPFPIFKGFLQKKCKVLWGSYEGCHIFVKIYHEFSIGVYMTIFQTQGF